MALMPGALYQGHKVQPRVLDLVSATVENTPETVAHARKDFINAIKPDLTSPEQPVVFRCTGINAAKPVDFHAYYDSGLEFNLSSGIVDQPVARFVCYDPLCYEVHDESKTMTHALIVADADCVVRKINGTWYNISTDFDTSVRAITKGIDGSIYLGGAFTDVGAATGDFIVKWDPYTLALSSLLNGTNDEVASLITAANGDIYLGGEFTDLTDANGDYISRWDGTAFNSLSTGLDSTCLALEIGHDGTLYLGGMFHLAAGVANTVHIAKWDGAAFTALGTGTNGIVRSIKVAPNGDIYIAGDFALAGGVANTAYIAKWNGTSWLPLGTGLDNTADMLAIDKLGNVYVGGDFHTADGVACAHIAKWNGKTFEPLGSGLNDACIRLLIDENGLLYATGPFTNAGGLDLLYFAIWNGSTWVHSDIVLPGAPAINALLSYNNDLYLGYDTVGAAVSSFNNTVTNSGSTVAYPVIKIKRANDGTTSVIKWLKNETLGDTLWCNYSLMKNETLTIDLTPGVRNIYSDYFGEVWRAVLRSSDLSTFRLIPGTNNISLFVSTDATITAWMEWPITHWGADMVAA
jgi:hypothetical protein